MKNILLPIDHSVWSEYTAEVASQISERTGATVHMLHVVEKPSYMNGDNNPRYTNIDDIISEVNRVIKPRFKDLKERFRMKQVATHEEVGAISVHAAINRLAEEIEADIIIMGAYGRAGSTEPFIGSNTERVMRSANIPILVVRSQFDEFDLKEVVFASAFVGEVYQAFPKLKRVLQEFDSKINLLKVITPNLFQRTADSLAMMEKFANHFDLTNYSCNTYCDITIEDGIISFAESAGLDVVAITTHGKRRLSHMIMRNITDEVVNENLKGILSVRISEPPPNVHDYFELEYEQELSLA